MTEKTSAQQWHETREYIRQRKAAYQMLGIVAREDLERFCRGKQTCFVPDDLHLTLILEGRREVYLRIMQHLELEVDELMKLFNARKPDGDDNA